MSSIPLRVASETWGARDLKDLSDRMPRLMAEPGRRGSFLSPLSSPAVSSDAAGLLIFFEGFGITFSDSKASLSSSSFGASTFFFLSFFFFLLLFASGSSDLGSSVFCFFTGGSSSLSSVDLCFPFANTSSIFSSSVSSSLSLESFNASASLTCFSMSIFFFFSSFFFIFFANNLSGKDIMMSCLTLEN